MHKEIQDGCIQHLKMVGLSQKIVHNITHERLTDQEYMKIMDVLEGDDFKDPWEGGKNA